MNPFARKASIARMPAPAIRINPARILWGKIFGGETALLPPVSQDAIRISKRRTRRLRGKAKGKY